MRRPLSLCLVVLLASLTLAWTAQAAPKWEFDPPHCYIGFAIKHILVPVQGYFTKFSGDVLFDPDDLASSRVNVAIEVASIETCNQKRDEDLKSDNYFAAQTYPQIRFVSQRIEALGQGRYLAHGELTIKNVTKPVDLPFTFLGKVISPMNMNVLVAGFLSRYTLDRLDYGVGDEKYFRMGALGKDVEITINLELTQVR